MDREFLLNEIAEAFKELGDGISASRADELYTVIETNEIMLKGTDNGLSC
jgi:hypothetical protein